MSNTDIIDVEYEQPACPTQHAWARVPVEPGPKQRAELKDRIRRLLRERNAVMVSHYYVHPDLQDLAEETGGIGVGETDADAVDRRFAVERQPGGASLGDRQLHHADGRAEVGDDGGDRHIHNGAVEHHHELRHREEVHPLTTREQELLRYFLENDGVVLSRARLQSEVWKDSADISSRSIDNFVMRLRRMIEDDPSSPRHLLSVRGTGYRFVREPAGETSPPESG